jgi:hypothetical protein
MMNTKEIQYKKALVNEFYYQALSYTSKAELQPILFYEEETTDNWTLKQCQIQYVKDQLEFIEGGNLDDEVEETWNLIYNNNNKENV